MIKLLITTIVFSLMIIQNVFPQKINYENSSVPAETSPLHLYPQNLPEQDFSNEELSIMNEMENLKRQDKAENREKICDLQKKLEMISGRTTTSAGTISIISSSENIKTTGNLTEAVTLNKIYNSFSGSIKAIATQVEQSLPERGTIWVAVASGRSDVGAGTSPDTILFFNSTNNGSSYSLVKRIALGVGIKVKSDQMDLEIVEPDTGSTYLHLVIGFIRDGYTGRSGAGLISLKKSDLSFGGTELYFPGNNIATNKYSKPRITSDNTVWPNDAYITIVVTQDSVDLGTNYILTKMCRIINPYTVTPLVTYYPSNFAVTFYGTSETAQTDIAFYSDGFFHNGDSLVFVQSGFPQLEHVVLIYKVFGFSSSQYPVPRRALIDFSHVKQYARIGSNGGDFQKKMMIVYTDNYLYNNSYLTELSSYKTTDGINWTKYVLISGYYDLNFPKNPDIIGKRFTDGKYNVAMKVETPLKDIFTTIVIEDLTIQSANFDLNNRSEKMEASVKPGFRNAPYDSSLMIFPSASGVNSLAGRKMVCPGFRFFVEGTYYTYGYYGNDMTTAFLRNASSPYNIMDSSQSYNFGAYPFHNSVSGSYYFSVRSRNALETWYYAPVNVNDSTFLPIEFYHPSAAYGNNLKLVDTSPVEYGIFSGDINYDGIIDVTDALKIYNDAKVLLTGYVVSDLDGNSFVDASDLLIVYNNMTALVSVIRP